MSVVCCRLVLSHIEASSQGPLHMSLVFEDAEHLVTCAHVMHYVLDRQGTRSALAQEDRICCTLPPTVSLLGRPADLSGRCKSAFSPDGPNDALPARALTL